MKKKTSFTNEVASEIKNSEASVTHFFPLIQFQMNTSVNQNCIQYDLS